MARYTHCQECGILLKGIPYASISRKSGVCAFCGTTDTCKECGKRIESFAEQRIGICHDCTLYEGKCEAITKTGHRCNIDATKGEYCHVHSPNGKYKKRTRKISKKKNEKHLQCRGVNKKGTRCQKKAIEKGWCELHTNFYEWDEYQDNLSLNIRKQLKQEGKSFKEIYHAYLKTKAWEGRAVECKVRSKYQCAVCTSNKNIAAHHRTYDHVFNEKSEDLICLCGDCHSKFHKVGDYG